MAQFSARSCSTFKLHPEKGPTMDVTLPPFFPHRRNPNGSFDSICLKCLLTIANARTEAELEKHDRDHVCNPSIPVPTNPPTEVHKSRVRRMKYIAEYAVNHLGNTRTGNVVLLGERAPKVGDIFNVRLEGYRIPVRIETVVGFRKELFGTQHASLICSPYTG